MEHQQRIASPATSPFCTFLKKQAVLDHVPANIFQSGICPSHYLHNNNLLETPPGMHTPRLRSGLVLPETVYYTVRLRGDRGKYPTPDDLRSLQDELAGVFKMAGFETMPIACRETWMADDWERKELERFDEVVPGNHGQDARCHQQKYQRTHGDMVLSFPFPAARVNDLCRAITAVEAHQKLHCGVGK